MPDSEYDDDMIDEEPIEAYCVSCRLTVEIEHPTPVWTRRGAPGTRGECPNCGTTVFRMGRTDAHHNHARPSSGRMMGKTAAALQKPGQPQFAAYINYGPLDLTIAARIADDLNRTGIPVWVDPNDGDQDKDQWASRVQPGLLECSHMVVVLSQSALDAADVEESWRFFRERRKPVVIAQVETCPVPDDLRRQPRFDFEADYKAAFRSLVQSLAG
jgi:hypothetical protein